VRPLTATPVPCPCPPHRAPRLRLARHTQSSAAYEPSTPAPGATLVPD
jgi:hypothetical protein